MVTIHNGVEVSADPGSGAAVRRELGLAPDDLVVVMLSALRPEKAHDVEVLQAQVDRLIKWATSQ